MQIINRSSPSIVVSRKMIKQSDLGRLDVLWQIYYGRYIRHTTLNQQHEKNETGQGLDMNLNLQTIPQADATSAASSTAATATNPSQVPMALGDQSRLTYRSSRSPAKHT